MTFLNPLKACTFSEMNIQITLDGEPAKGAEVIRLVKWKKEKIDNFTADEEGRVELPAMFESSTTNLLPMEFVATQLITVKYKGKEYEIWNYAKRKPEKNFELEGKPFSLKCELSKEDELHEVFSSLLVTQCTWE
ncbi:hypothetical protein OQJ68_00600 [Microbulbifer thermotolerans]|uniref:DUF6795 domain-containing protein n=2 Tax=Microbulbifer thermotolerans TaxID=252514 RepID=A0AB35HTB3_MICTH|nr:DUF6795 domain-containing protein [Microbulbifer thermotolerans]MCX2795567.1 hypothetical protein [Microbulbifer thermotolerans]MCX2800280.1 hypothetical protein [Microbulbifer thermotolerans]